MNKRIIVIIFGLALFLGACTIVPANPVITEDEASVSQAMVQVWSAAGNPDVSRTLVSFGLIVGDGSQVLTFLDYEDYTPGNLEVVTRSYGTYNAFIQAIDPRTGISLVKLQGASRLPAVALNDIEPPEYGNNVLVWGWTGPDYGTFQSSIAEVSGDQAPRPRFFSVAYTNALVRVTAPGAVVTDLAGNVLGLETTFRSRLAIILGPIGMMPPIASISSGIELLSPDVGQKPWAGGPAISAIANKSRMSGYFAGVLPSPSDYDKMALATQELLGRLGEPVATDDLHLSNIFWFETLEGVLLVMVYPRPVDLWNSTNGLLAQAKWVGIEWDREGGEPNRLVYGAVPYAIQGGFALLGDVTDLKESVPPLDSPNAP